MITNADMTLYHAGYDPATRDDCYTRRYFDRVSLQEDVKVTVLDNGLKSANVIQIRIPISDDIKIANGDKVVIGQCDEPEPPQDTKDSPYDVYTVIGYADNRKGSAFMWHWKVVCA